MILPAAKEPQRISRPLKVLVPLIQAALQRGYSAGLEHYVSAGETRAA
jgi:hypothetical protein